MKVSLAIGCVAFLAACSQGAGGALTKDDAAALILNSTKNVCDSANVAPEGYDTPEEYAELVSWVHHNLQNSTIQLVSQGGGLGPESGQYHYAYNGASYDLTITSNPTNNFFVVTTCLYPIKSVEVEDMTRDAQDPKVTRVIYLEHRQPSPLAVGLLQIIAKYPGNDIDSFPINDPRNNSWSTPQENRVLLRRLDAGGWRVEEADT
jgi:hypothetical protein